jgi:hypothetical protein
MYIYIYVYTHIYTLIAHISLSQWVYVYLDTYKTYIASCSPMCQLASPCHVKVRRLYLNSSAASGFGYIMVTIVEYMYVYIYINNGIWDIWSTLICGCVWKCWIHQFTAISIGNSTVFPWPNQRMHCKRIQLIPTKHSSIYFTHA